MRLKPGEELCPKCNGNGFNVYDGNICPHCYGEGKLEWIEKIKGKKRNSILKEKINEILNYYKFELNDDKTKHQIESNIRHCLKDLEYEGDIPHSDYNIDIDIKDNEIDVSLRRNNDSS